LVRTIMTLVNISSSPNRRNVYMRIPTEEIPQADELSDVAEVVRAVAGGATTFQGIADAIGKVYRQGRYYRRAAEILGLVESAGPNASQLTALGRDFAVATNARGKAILLRAVAGAQVFQRVMPFLESKLPGGCTPEDFKGFLDGVTEPTGETMMPRRAHTIISWLKSVGLVRSDNDRYVLCPLPGHLKTIHFSDDSEPLVPTKFTLKDYQEVQAKLSEKAGAISVMIEEAKLERAKASHGMLTNLVAARLRAAGAIPRCNGLVDLAARVSGASFIFEMKSTGPKNLRSQIRSGISQLYEYRYLQNAPEANLVLVIEKPLSKELAWMSDYLLKDRGIFFCWDGDRRRLHCPQSLTDKLGFLVA
jgi:hypothetical protein